MVAPLLGLMALAGGVMGQKWYLDEEERKERERARGILGNAPEVLGGDVAGPPRPGTGLMGRLMSDPANEANQYAFIRGIMDLPTRERAVAHTLFSGIMGRSQQAALSREGWARQEAMTREQEGNTQRRFDASQEQAQSHFDSTMSFNREKFETDKAQWGETRAFEMLKFRNQQANDAFTRGIQAAQEARAVALHPYQLYGTAANAFNAGQPEQARLPVGYERVEVSGGEGGGNQVVIRPVRGSPDWEKGKEKVDAVLEARQNIANYAAHLAEFGTEHVGAERTRQNMLYGRVQESVRLLANMGVLNAGELPLIEAQLPNPTSFGRRMISDAEFQNGLTALDDTFRSREDRMRQTYLGWGYEFSPQRKPRVEGRDQPPRGSVEVRR